MAKSKPFLIVLAESMSVMKTYSVAHLEIRLLKKVFRTFFLKSLAKHCISLYWVFSLILGRELWFLESYDFMLKFPELIRYSGNLSLLEGRGFELKNKVLANC